MVMPGDDAKFTVKLITIQWTEIKLCNKKVEKQLELA